MLEKAQLAAIKISTLDTLTTSSIDHALSQLSTHNSSRLVVTDQAGKVIYNSQSKEKVNTYSLTPEIAHALSGKDVFTWVYHDGTMRSEAATPIISYGLTVGCVYMTEYDTEQGALIRKLQMTVLTISILLEAGLLVFAFFSSKAFSSRLRKITNSMRIIQEGDYSSRVTLRGRDELNYLASEFNNLTHLLQISENKRRQFVSDASHELKTPLASIKLLSDSILQNDMDIDTIKEFVSDIGEEAERLNHMAEKLLDLTRREDDSDEDDLEIIYMEPTIRRAVHMLSSLAQASNISILTQLENDTTILMREGDLYHIVYNLIENGIKYNVLNGSVNISLRRDDEYAILKISDTGTGIPEEALGKIFERFFRVDKARSRTTGGSGLGLAIVKNMVDRNQATITVQSQLGVGTVFTICFPAFDIDLDECE